MDPEIPQVSARTRNIIVGIVLLIVIGAIAAVIVIPRLPWSGGSSENSPAELPRVTASSSVQEKLGVLNMLSGGSTSSSTAGGFDIITATTSQAQVDTITQQKLNVLNTLSSGTSGGTTSGTQSSGSTLTEDERLKILQGL